jgi:uncharacterized membrane protein YidH (DUF202 family)
MSVIRTSLSLISFGFTIYQFFQHLSETGTVATARVPARNFGLSLLALGILMLLLGIGYHLAFMRGLRHERRDMAAEGLIHAESRFPASMTLIVAVLLLILAVMAIVSIALRAGPFD